MRVFRAKLQLLAGEGEFCPKASDLTPPCIVISVVSALFRIHHRPLKSVYSDNLDSAVTLTFNACIWRWTSSSGGSLFPRPPDFNPPPLPKCEIPGKRIEVAVQNVKQRRCTVNYRCGTKTHCIVATGCVNCWNEIKTNVLYRLHRQPAADLQGSPAGSELDMNDSLASKPNPSPNP